jgi:hypothetical protein
VTVQKRALAKLTFATAALMSVSSAVAEDLSPTQVLYGFRDFS